MGIVENMSYVKCPDCRKVIEIFGKSRADALAKEFGVENVAKIPFDNALTTCSDRGLIELFEGDYFQSVFRKTGKERRRIKVLETHEAKERLWHSGDETYYPEGGRDADYCVLKFTAETDGITATSSENFDI